MTASPLPAIWLAEGQSSQRDMLLSLQLLKQSADFNLIASHSQNRPEILGCADIHYLEPLDKHDLSAIPLFVLEKARAHNVKVLLTGRNGRDYERFRTEFEQAGIRLLTGATDIAMLDKIDDKFAFMQHCHTHNIPVATGWRFDTEAELLALLVQHGKMPLCVKPVSGIFAQGFWRLDTGRLDTSHGKAKALGSKDNHAGWDSFEHLYFTDARKIHLEQFLFAYRHSKMVQERPIPMLLMPYLSGREYSIDVVCERGEVLAAVTRYKAGNVQHIGYDTAIMALIFPLIRAFGCDGIVSVQTRATATGEHRVLEINSRASGGIDYTTHSSVDLTQLGFVYWLGVSNKPICDTIAQQIVPCTVRPITRSVKI